MKDHKKPKGRAFLDEVKKAVKNKKNRHSVLEFIKKLIIKAMKSGDK